MNVFDIINNISSDAKVKFTKEEVDEFYSPYLAIEYFSKFEDTIFIINEINSFKKQPSKYEHYLYLHSVIRKRRRPSFPAKKKDTAEEDIKAVMDYYQYSKVKAKEALQLLSIINIKDIKNSFIDMGGVVK
jgi:recombinational DNA repair protein (RecF pathway)